MDIMKLKNNNPIEQITEETVATLTEPIQPQYLLLTLDKKHGFDIRIADASGFERPNGANAQTVFSRDTEGNIRQVGLNRVFDQGQIIEADGILERATSQGDQSYDERAESQGFDTVEALAEMGSGWGDITVDALYLAADITMIGETDNNDKQKPKFVREANADKRNNKIITTATKCS